MQRQLHKPILFCGLVAIVGIIQFGVAVGGAMNASAQEYRMTSQFLSDLGRSDNPASAPIFNRGVIFLGLTLIPFFLVMPRVLHRLRTTLRVAGVMSACGLIGIGLTPYDRYFAAHQVFLVLWIAPMLLLMVLFFINAVLDGFATRWLTISTLLTVFAVCGYALIGIHQGHVVFQKLVAVLAVGWFALVFLSVLVTTVGSITSRREIVEHQAAKYLRSIERNHRRR